MSTATIPGHRELAASITLDRDRLADLYRDATVEYERRLEKLDEHAAWIAEKMQRLRINIADSRAVGPTALSINGVGELQGQGPELDRLCSEVTNQRALVSRLGQVLGVAA